MTVVIPFAPRRRAPGQAAPLRQREAGAILFFTGVRYERPAEAVPPPKPARRSPRSGTKAAALAASARQPV